MSMNYLKRSFIQTSPEALDSRSGERIRRVTSQHHDGGSAERPTVDGTVVRARLLQPSEPVFLHLVDQRHPADAESPCRLGLVPARGVEGARDEAALEGLDLLLER